MVSNIRVVLIAEFKIDVSPSAFASILPPIVHQDLGCPYCPDTPMHSKRAPRTSYLKSYPFCPTCKHRHVQMCTCENCNKLAMLGQKIIREKRQGLVAELAAQTVIEINLQDMTLTDTLYLLSATHRNSINSINTYETLSPAEYYTNYIIGHLLSRKFILPCKTADISAFEFNQSNTKITAFYLNRVKWQLLPGLTPEQRQEFLKQVQLRVDGEWPASWRAESSLLWRDLAKAECIGNLTKQVNMRNFPVEISHEKGDKVFNYLFEHFTIAQVFTLAYYTARDITDFAIRTRIPKYKCSKMFINNLQKKAERFIAQKWHVPNSDDRFFQSTICNIFFEDFLNIGQAASTLPVPKIDQAELAIVRSA